MAFYFHNMRYSIKIKDMFKQAKNIQLNKKGKKLPTIVDSLFKL